MKNGIRSNRIPSFITLTSSHDSAVKIIRYFCKRKQTSECMEFRFLISFH
jgi:hypothetical protein